MGFDLTTLVFLALLSLAASTVNGALGYGYSSLSTPLAILAVVSRIINPVYVIIEGVINSFILVFTGTRNIKATFRRVLPIIVALVPSVAIGSIVLAVVSPAWVRLVVYVTLLPMILLQAAGFRRPIQSERNAGIPLGVGVGFLYSITTISGPPIALFWNNQGLVKGEFRAAIAQIRIVESVTTIIAYSLLGLFTATTFQLFSYIGPPVLLGIPLGFLIMRRVEAEVFRRFVMSFDGLVVGYGLAVVLGSLFGLIDIGYMVWLLVSGINVALLYRFLKGRRRQVAPLASSSSRKDSRHGPYPTNTPPLTRALETNEDPESKKA
jgi:uncharacterized membrane protein YfcA